MKTLLALTAALEVGTGVALVVAPSIVVNLLLGSSLSSPAVAVLCRLLGAALLSLGSACWLAREDVRSRTTVGLIWAMLLYNIAAASLLGYARFGLAMSGVALLPAAILHSVFGAWCVGCLRSARRDASVEASPRQLLPE